MSNRVPPRPPAPRRPPDSLADQWLELESSLKDLAAEVLFDLARLLDRAVTRIRHPRGHHGRH